MSLTGIFRSRLWLAAWGAFSRAFILLGLPLLAWGLVDYARFLAEPARAAYASLVLVQALAVGWLIYVMPPSPQSQRNDEPHWHASLHELILIVAAYGDRRSILTWHEIPGLRWVGVALVLLAIVLSIWASVTWSQHLRREGPGAWPDPVILPAGPFQWIRYPALASMALLSLGFAILTRSWPGLALMLPLLAVLANRIASLERRNAGRYGREWVERCRTSWRVVPFLY